MKPTAKCFTCLFLFFLLLSFSKKAAAQSSFWGLKGGVNLGKVGNIEVQKSNIGVGYHAGIFVTFLVSDRISFTHELLFSQRGLSVQINDTIAMKAAIRYIEFPWLVNYHFSPAMFFNIGVTPGVSTYFKAAINDTLRIYNGSNSIPIDFAVLIGAGGYVTEKIGMGVRMNLGLIKAFDIENCGKNMILQAYVSYAVNRSARGRRRYSGGGGSAR